VLDILWEHSPLTSSQIVDALENMESWHSRTIKSLINRLLKKKAIGHKEDGNRYLKIAKILGVDRSTIYRELKRNSFKHWRTKCNIYWNDTAHQNYLDRRKRKTKLDNDVSLKYYIHTKLKLEHLARDTADILLYAKYSILFALYTYVNY